MNFIRDHSIATNWRKISMPVSIAGTSCGASASVVVLQILGVDGLNVDTVRWNQNDFLMAVFPELLREIHQFCLYRKYSACVKKWEKSFCASSTILIQNSSSRSCSGWDARYSGYFNKRSWIPLKCFMMHLFFKLWAWWTLSFLEFPISVTTRSSLLNHVVRNREKVRCILDDPSTGFTFFQETHRMWNRQCHRAWKAFCALRLRSVSNNPKQLYVTHVLNHFRGRRTKRVVGFILW